jgi:hypothetical protein
MTRIWLGIMALTLSMIGCTDQNETDEKLIFGTWRAHTREYFQDEKNYITYDVKSYDYKITFNEGVLGESAYSGTFYETFRYYIYNGAGDVAEVFEDNPLCMGNYTANTVWINIEVTHFYGDYFGLESKWYPINYNENGINLALIKEKFFDERLFFYLPLICLPQSFTYSIGTSFRMMTTVDGAKPISVTTSFTKIDEVE